MYEILDDFNLSNPKKIGKEILDLDENTLTSFYAGFKDYYTQNLTSIISFFQSSEDLNIYPSSLVQYPETKFTNFSKRLCIYADKIILHDPVYAILKSLDQGFSIDFVKNSLKQVLPHVLELRELADNEILYYIPYERIISPANAELNKMAKADCSDPIFRKICFENLEVGLDRAETDDLSYSFTLIRLGLRSPSKFSAGLHFHGSKGPIGLQMGMGQPFELKTKGKSIKMRPLRIPRNQVEKDPQIKKQVDQLILFQAKELISSLYFTQLFNARLITDFDVAWKLLNWKFGNLDKDLKAISTILEIDLKFLDNLEIKDILRVRKKEHSAFEDFRHGFQELCQEVKSIPKSEDFHSEVKNLRKEKFDPQLRKLDRGFKRIRNYRFLRGAAIGIGSLSGAAVLGSLAPSVFTGGFAAILREYAEFRKESGQLEENTLYFLWKLKRK